MKRNSNYTGFWTLTFLVVANMIGAGVFTTSGFSLAALGSRELVLWAWAVAGVIALAGAFSYGRLVQAMPESGGEYLFLSRAAHPLLGFIAGWVSLIAGFSGAIAFAATTLEEYAVPFESRPEWFVSGSIAVFTIVIAGALHGFFPRSGASLQNLVVGLKLVLLFGMLAFAASILPFEQSSEVKADPLLSAGISVVPAFAGSLVWISLSYSGFNAAVYLAGEVHDARAVVPRSMIVATIIVTVLYLCLNTVFIFAAPVESIAGKPDITAVAANSLGGQLFETFVRWTIVACLLTSVLSMMMAAPRVYAKMANDSLLPRVLRFNHEESRSPQMATLLQVLLAIALVLATTLRGLLTYLGLTLSVCAACSVACLFLPAIRKSRGWHVEDLIPLFYLAATLVSAAMLAISDPKQVVGTVVTFSVGALAYFLIPKPE